MNARVDIGGPDRPSHSAADWLAERIPALCDASGALPPQAVLAQELGVSRALLREAISQLVARGVVDVRTKVGSRVVEERQWQIVDRHVVGWRLARATDPAFAADIAAIRSVLEPIAAADAAQHATPEQRARITVACATRLTATSLATYVAARHELHVAILAASANQVLQQLTCLVPTPDRMGAHDAGAPAIAAGERQALALLEAAIRNGDSGAARAGIERLNRWDLPRIGGGHSDAHDY
ncbi:regulatory protein GntR HTH [Burkholderia ambifaria IOP40-10]|uniref:Regulatory protein GntR HTH n=1 Tax=Burkholderia ambifaria IOP40-10 TaxID=396596 RepID=B1F9B6_9BURK|nr:GntR family transcriptional regulator [Burkholderia ambifaria]EDT05888.1 regulatory protein GntR HTH [Burkholderia ambifaria IOP40-10]